MIPVSAISARVAASAFGGRVLKLLARYAAVPIAAFKSAAYRKTLLEKLYKGIIPVWAAVEVLDFASTVIGWAGDEESLMAAVAEKYSEMAVDKAKYERIAADAGIDPEAPISTLDAGQRANLLVIATAKAAELEGAVGALEFVRIWSETEGLDVMEASQRYTEEAVERQTRSLVGPAKIVKQLTGVHTTQLARFISSLKTLLAAELDDIEELIDMATWDD